MLVVCGSKKQGLWVFLRIQADEDNLGFGVREEEEYNSILIIDVGVCFGYRCQDVLKCYDALNCII